MTPTILNHLDLNLSVSKLKIYTIKCWKNFEDNVSDSIPPIHVILQFTSFKVVDDKMAIETTIEREIKLFRAI